MPCGNYQKLTVRDTGHGIAAQHLERIFDPYFTTKEKGEGTGLGLAVVQGIVKNHGGVVTVQSDLGKGTEFCVYLPIVEKPQLPAEQTTPQQIQIGSECILFIDDELTIVDIAQNMLQRLGYTTVTRSGSVEALELFQNDPYRFDLVITDVTMPNISGDVLAKRMRKMRGDIPIIMCTGYSERINEKQAAELGVSCILTKPFLFKDLAASVRAALDVAPGRVPQK
jgi:two-component system cell cycle sensor histidine kinase/response regulator CckA